MSAASLIEAQAIEVAAGRRFILPRLDIGFRAGELAVVVGPNGAGKSTLLKALTGEARPRAGQVRLAGRPLGAWTPEALARRRAVLPQAVHVAFPFTVAEIVALGLEARGGLDRDARARETVRLLDRVGLGGFAGRQIETLSGGEQQRCHLARVLGQIGAPVAGSGEPRLLFLDEPTASLDIRHQVAVLEIARDYARNGAAVVAVLHDLNLAGAYADRLVVLDGGRVVADGSPARVLTPGILEPVFGLPLAFHGGHGTRAPFVAPRAFESPPRRSTSP